MGRSPHLLTSPFGSLIEEARRENLRLLESSGHLRAPRASQPHPSPDVDVTIEASVVSHPPPAAERRRRLLLPVSVAVHALGLAALVLVPVLTPESLPAPTTDLRAFFAAPPLAPPPPPPPPPPASGPKLPRSEAQKPLPDPAKWTTPQEAKLAAFPGEAIDLDVAGEPGGVPGGVEGGVPGGVVGGVVGGLPDAPPAPRPVRVGGQIKQPQQLKHVPPVYPDAARRARIQGVVILECTISEAGRVLDVKILRGVPLLDDAAMQAVKQWLFVPTLLDGVPVPIVATVTVSFSLKQAS